MNIFIVLYLCLHAVALGFFAARHGQPQPRANIWHGLAASTIQIGLLWFGGAFS